MLWIILLLIGAFLIFTVIGIKNKPKFKLSNASSDHTDVSPVLLSHQTTKNSKDMHNNDHSDSSSDGGSDGGGGE
jgi:uncharacterized membrane protein YgcG